MGHDMVYEKVPVVSRRIGDHVMANQNNSTIILGRDRAGSVDSGYGSDTSAGAFHAIVGRKGVDPSTTDDAATIYMSSKTDPDSHAGTAGIGAPDKAASGIILRGDCIRISSRKNIVFAAGKSIVEMSSTGIMTADAMQIFLGRNASSPVVLALPYRPAEDAFFASIVAAFTILATHPAIAAVVPIASAMSVPATAFSAFQSGSPTFLSKVVLAK